MAPRVCDKRVVSRPHIRSPSLRRFRSSVTIVWLGNVGARFIERRGASERAVEYDDPMRAFVAVCLRARALLAQGFEEASDLAGGSASPVAPPRTYADLERYVSSVDGSRSLVGQETVVAGALAHLVPRGDPRAARAAAVLSLVAWPTVADVASILARAPEPEPALFAVLERELFHSREYPKELVRIACAHGSARTVGLALRALARTRDPDAWLDVLIEGEPWLNDSHLPALAMLIRRAPSREVAKVAREVVRDLEAARPRRASSGRR